jgi:hypothetical protein
MIPQRGRECQCRHSPSPMSSFDTFTQWWRSGSAIIDSIRARFDSSASTLRPRSA